ncbi:hypothetical protein [Gloeothece verrucosa]|uniref:hypothetical protein n=1 Tax=Gloeothece verrucosa TaxID=2546359 RepID=UPI0012FEC371|nr:hypothetical protein [Gloeothece verrucosa]
MLKTHKVELNAAYWPLVWRLLAPSNNLIKPATAVLSPNISNAWEPVLRINQFAH